MGIDTDTCFCHYYILVEIFSMDDQNKTDNTVKEDLVINEEETTKPVEDAPETAAPENAPEQQEDETISEESQAKDTLGGEVSKHAIDNAQQVDFLVKSLIAEQADIREKLKEQRAMLKDVLESDVNYRDIDEQMKNLAKRKKQVQQTLADSEGTKQAKEEMQGLRNDLKVVEKKLTGYLQQYLDTYNTRTIEDRDGQLREIITQYKLVKKVA